MSDAERSRILLAEDDPVSLAFVAEALRGLGFAVDAAIDGHAALSAARSQGFDVLMLDHHLPGRDGDSVLRALRADAGAASRAIVAIATTAEPDPSIHAHLRSAGFARVLVKPLDRASLRDALRKLGIACTHASRDSSPALDDEAGLRASGSPQALAALRGLFARELDVLANEWNSLRDDGNALANEWNSLRDDGNALAGRLHRLRAASGFCGASALQLAAEELSEALRDAGLARIEQARNEFQQALAATREALAHAETACG